MLARLGLGLGALGLGRTRPPVSAGADALATTFDAELLEGVAAFVETERFLAHLKASSSAATAAAAAAPTTTPTTTKPHLKLVEREKTPPTSSAAAAAAAAAEAAAAEKNKAKAGDNNSNSNNKAAADVDDDELLSSSGVLVAPAADGGYVVVTRQDAVEAMAYFIADCLSRSPETAGLDPKQLQKALGEAMVTLKRARWRAVLGWGRVAVAALSYGASVAFAAGGGGAPPAVYRAVVAALWAAARMAYRAVA